MGKPHGSYEDWKGSVNTLTLSNGDILAEVEVLDLWMSPTGPPHALQCLYKDQTINIPFEKVMHYIIHSKFKEEVPPADYSTYARNPECVEKWPECENGAYNPLCCRFPKSCSC